MVTLYDEERSRPVCMSRSGVELYQHEWRCTVLTGVELRLMSRNRVALSLWVGVELYFTCRSGDALYQSSRVTVNQQEWSCTVSDQCTYTESAGVELHCIRAVYLHWISRSEVALYQISVLTLNQQEWSCTVSEQCTYTESAGLKLHCIRALYLRWISRSGVALYQSSVLTLNQ
jgi:hypothetical protein